MSESNLDETLVRGPFPAVQAIRKICAVKRTVHTATRPLSPAGFLVGRENNINLVTGCVNATQRKSVKSTITNMTIFSFAVSNYVNRKVRV